MLLVQVNSFGSFTGIFLLILGLFLGKNQKKVKEHGTSLFFGGKTLNNSLETLRLSRLECRLISPESNKLILECSTTTSSCFNQVWKGKNKKQNGCEEHIYTLPPSRNQRMEFFFTFPHFPSALIQKKGVGIILKICPGVKFKSCFESLRRLNRNCRLQKHVIWKLRNFLLNVVLRVSEFCLESIP